MQEILRYFWHICLLRAGPERLPATGFALALSFVAFFLVAIATNLLSRSDIGLGKGIGFILIGLGVQTGVVVALLAFKSLTHRFIQTMTALLGANALILLLTLPISVLLIDIEQSPIRLLLESVFLCIFVWWLTIAGYVLSRAANISLALGIATAFGIEILAISSTYAAFPAS